MAGMSGHTVEHNETPVGKAESILAAAKRTFLASGFGAVSMDTIAREAGVSKATVYAHFAGKEELFGAVIGRECGLYFARFSAGELNPNNVRASLTVLGRRFLELVLSPDAIALHRIILGEVTRFPGLGEVFWRAGPERQRVQIEAFLQVAASRGTLSLPIPGSLPSSSLGWCAVTSSCATCCASKRNRPAGYWRCRRRCRRHLLAGIREPERALVRPDR